MKLAGITDIRLALEALRDRLAGVLDGDVGHRAGCSCECGVPPDMRAIPSTAKEYREVLNDLAAMPIASGVSELDQLSAARKARQEAARTAAAQPAQRPGVRQQRGAGSDHAGRDSRPGA